ncbi:hypothetical protein ACIRPK_26700 [Kitasatospora sp. NPDC101801]|uniref:hypothetical protein n=1 Tax=Kitasatospora sp. NPDC101801 TaxID=3364103 RepID=UPI0038284C6F
MTNGMWFFTMALTYRVRRPLALIIEDQSTTVYSRVSGYTSRSDAYKAIYEFCRGNLITDLGMPATIRPSVQFWTLDRDDLTSLAPPGTSWHYTITFRTELPGSPPTTEPTHRTFSGTLDSPVSRYDAYKEISDRAHRELGLPDDGTFLQVTGWTLGPDVLD